MIQSVIAVFMSVITFFGGLFGLQKKEINLDDFKLEWSDEFEGDTLDLTKWQGLNGNTDRALVRKGGYLHRDMVEVKNGNLYINTKYLEEGAGGCPAGYYSQILLTKNLHEQTYGYFEIRCILPKGEGQWAAFWMNSHTMANVDGTGVDGAEIDIFESPYYGSFFRRDRISSNIHYDGYGEDLKSKNVGVFKANNPYEEFNTYGLEWNEDEYIFYINGKETRRSSFGGTSQTPEYLILSVEVGGSNGTPDPKSWAGDMTKNDHLPSAFIVDYVRAYQYK